jgi:polycomb group RING finger protein 4
LLLVHRTLKGMESDESIQKLLKPKYLNCPAVFKVEHLKKFIVSKFAINCSRFNVEISYKVKTIVLPEHYTLMDVAYIYTWKKVIEGSLAWIFQSNFPISKTVSS